MLQRLARVSKLNVLLIVCNSQITFVEQVQEPVVSLFLMEFRGEFHTSESSFEFPNILLKLATELLKLAHQTKYTPIQPCAGHQLETATKRIGAMELRPPAQIFACPSLQSAANLQILVTLRSTAQEMYVFCWHLFCNHLTHTFIVELSY